MNKRILALLCLVCLVVGVFAFGVKADTSSNYRVGYSIKDINPWIDPNDHSKGIIEGIEMKGRGANDAGRYATYIHDDDGDGNVTYTWKNNSGNTADLNTWTADTDGGDGLHATCTAITDAKGTTVLLISLDMLGAYGGLTYDARAAIVDQFAETFGAGVIRKDNIILSGSHTHSAFNFGSATLFRNEDAPFHEYYEYVLAQITAAAVEAYNDRAVATMSKGSIDAGTVAQANGKKYQMNFIRHYQRDYYDKWDYDTNGKLVTYDTPYEFSLVQGSNFGTVDGVRKYIEKNESTAANPIPNQPYVDNALNKTVGVVFDKKDNGDSGTKASYLATADDMMHLIQFEFENGSGKDPIVLLNWRAHTTENGGDFVGGLSSDYVGPLRAMMKDAGYRMSFFLGGAGDLIINQFNSQDPEDTPWRETISKGEESDVQAYGRLLYKVATECLTKNMSVKTPGDILTSVSSFEYSRQVDSEGLRAALADLKEKHTIDYDDNGNEIQDAYTKSWKYYPYSYQHTDGKTYTINSYFHANGIEDRLDNTEDSTYSMTLTAVTLGKAAAFVTAPFEIADRYDSVNPLNNALNDWLTLGESGGFGTPFVLSCTNGYSGYIPYSYEYIYNTDEYAQVTGTNAKASMIYGPGTYEANITPAARGTGEQMVAHMLGMLKSLNTAKTAYCEHCKQDVIWQPLNNDTADSQYNGHYYLTEDIVDGPRIIINKGMSVCVDLNGKTYSAKGTAFHTYSGGPELSIFDSSKDGTGKVIGHSAVGYSTGDSTQYRGGVVVISGNSTVNIYGGTFSFEELDVEDAVPLSQGGAVCVLGTLNMYGGKLEGADLEVTDWVNSNGALPDYNGYGAAVFVSGTFNISGGTITAGTVPSSGEGRCVFLAGANSRMNLSGDAVIDEIMLNSVSYHNQLIVEGVYTGSAHFAITESLENKNVYSSDNKVAGHNAAVMAVNAMPVNRYSAVDPNTPVTGEYVLAPDTAKPESGHGYNGYVLRLKKAKSADCEACGEENAQWWPVYNTTYIPSDATGHYYLAENITAENGRKIIAEAGKNICLDLNGKTYEVNNTAIHPYQQGKISIVDHSANKNGQIISHPGGQTTGGVILVSANSEVKIYGGTFSYVPTQDAPAEVVSGGIAYINSSGRLNVNGGTLQGAALVNSTESTVTTKGLGATVTVLSDGTLKVAGGELTAGTAPRGANCVYLAATTSKLELAGDGSIEHVQANWNTDEMFTVIGEYTGHTAVTFSTAEGRRPLANGLDIGTSKNAVITEANLTVMNSGGWSVQVSGNDLVLSNDQEVAIYNGEADAEPEYHATLNDAISVYEGGIIRLMSDVAQSVHVTKDVYLDLNGCNITGAVTVDDGKTLYCMDNTTDDYDVTEDEYGKISNYTGNVAGVAADSGVVNKDYLIIHEDGVTSFHCVNLKLTHMTLIPEVAGIKYKSAFEGDQVVARNVLTYGIAFNLSGEPSTETMAEGTYSKFTTFLSGADANGTSAGTLLKGVMKETNNDFSNSVEAKRPIYGSAYIKTKDTVIFGSAATRSFREQIELVDDYWGTLSQTQKNAAVDMYRTFVNNMQYWDVPNMKAAAGN